MSSLRSKARFAGRLFVLLAVPLFVLVAAYWALGSLEDQLPARLSFQGGIVFAIALLAVTCTVTQRCTGFTRNVRWFPIAYAGALVLGQVGATEAYNRLKADNHFRAAEATPVAIDVLLVQPRASTFRVIRPAPEVPNAPADALGWDVRFSIASAIRPTVFGHGLKVNLESRSRRAAVHALTGSLGPFVQRGEPLVGSVLSWTGWRPEAAHAMVLNVDGIEAHMARKDARSWPADWEPLIGKSTLGVPVHVILGAAGTSRLHAWREWAARHGGDVVQFRDAGRPLLVDAAFRIATERSDEFTDAALARRYRPKLLFDTGEDLPNPLDIESFLGSSKVKVCGRVGRSEVCRKVNRSSALDPVFEYLDFDPNEFRTNTEPSAIYYHVVRDDEGNVYLDYWWFFPFNPTAVAQDFLCKPGLTLGPTCFDHVSDWEGITVVLRKDDDGRFVPRHVIYAQHEFGAAFKWHKLRERWQEEGRLDGDRPIVFVATDSHASYPTSCTRGGCAQIHRPVIRKDGKQDGLQEWLKNDELACLRACLKRFPQTRDGKPALWNASPWVWGKSICLPGTSYCSTGPAPRAPAYQARFSEPWKPLDGKSVEFRELDATYATYG
jgi:hypothetical protein